jgi:hypothetical protein
VVYSLVGLAGLSLAYTATMRHAELPIAKVVPASSRI